jgi:serine/threonine protein kinase
MSKHRRKISQKVTPSDAAPGEVEAGKVEAGKVEAGKVEAGKVEAGETVSARAMDTEYDLDSLLESATKSSMYMLLQADAYGDLISRLKDPRCLRQLLQDLPPEPLSDVIVRRGRIGQFELLEPLGGGGMGEVFKARHLQLGRIVAVKMLHPHRLGDPLAIRRFRQEVRAVGQLHNRHLVSATHADEESGIPYLVMDYVPGLSLRQLADKLAQAGNRMTIGVACELIRQAATGVQFAHEHGIIHRDLKPSNLMLDPSGTVRVLDLGLAKVKASADPTMGDLTANEDMTGSFDVVGTPDYMAPEQIRESRGVDERTDVYALGATLFRLLTGQTPYRSISSTDGFLNKAARILQDPVPDIRCFRDDVSPELAVVINRCLAKDPADRIASAKALAEQLATWSDPLQVHALAESLNGPFQSAAPTRDLGVSIATAVSPAVESSGRPPSVPSNRGWWLAGSLLPFFLAGWIVYRLSHPAGGELVVQCADDIEITIRAVQEDNVKSLELIREPSGRLTLSSGPWRLSLQGRDADQYALSEDTIVITSGGRPRVRVTRITDSSAVAGEASPLALQRSSITQQEVNESRVFLPGLVQRPTLHNPVIEWQMLLKRPLSGIQLDRWKWSVRHFDVTHNGSHWADSLGSHVLVRDCQSGQVTAVVTAVRPEDFYHSVAFHPTGDSFAVLVQSRLDQHHNAIELRSPGGVLRQRIEYGVDLPWDSESKNECFAWSGDGTNLFVWSDQHLLAYDRNGNLLKTLPLIDSSRKSDDFAVSVCSDHASVRPDSSELTLLCDDAVVRTWDIVTGEVRELGSVGVSTLPEGLDVSLKWSPDGERLLVTGLDDSGDDRIAKIYRGNGELLATCQREWQQAAWSGDGELLVTDEGHLLDHQLQTIRQLPTATNDPAVGVRRYPYWADSEEIVMVYADDRWQRRSGIIRRFRPSGAELPTNLEPQPLQPMSVGPLTDGRNAVVYHRGGTHRVLFHWSPEGHGMPALELPELAASGSELQPYEAAMSSTNDRIVLRSTHHQFVLSNEGKLIQETALENSDRHDAAFQPNGKWLAFVQQPDASLLLQHTEESTIRTIGAASYNATLCWSGDGRFLAWQHPEPNEEFPMTSVIDLQRPESRPIRLGHTQGRVSFSPNCEWVACIESDTHSAKLVVTELSSDRRLEVSSAIDPFVHSSPLWMSDSQHVFAGEVFRLDNLESLVQVGDLGIGDWTGGIAGSPGKELVIFVNQFRGSPGLCTVDSTGSLVQFTPMAGPLLPSAINGSSIQSPREPSNSGNHALLVADARLMEPYGVSLVSFDQSQTPTSLWAGIAFDDGFSVSINASGEIRRHTDEADLDNYLLHMIRYPSGPSIPLTQREFVARRSLTEDQLALVWAIDLKAHVEQISGDVWDAQQRNNLLTQTDNRDSWPLAAEITLLDLSNNRELSDIELQFVARFSKLRRLRTYPVTRLCRKSIFEWGLVACR